MRTLFRCPSYSVVTCLSYLPEEYRLLPFGEMTLGMVSVFSALLGSTMDTCTALVYEASAVSVDGRPAAAMVSQMSWITSSSGDGYLDALSFSVSCVLGSVAQGFVP